MALEAERFGKDVKISVMGIKLLSYGSASSRVKLIRIGRNTSSSACTSSTAGRASAYAYIRHRRRKHHSSAQSCVAVHALIR